MSRQWDPALYQSSHSFVWEYGRELINLLSPAAGERILDVGCGTGQLTAEIARSGAEVLGIDSSPAMIAQAATNSPGLRFARHDVSDLPFDAEFDAVFSNAVLHWVWRADEAAAAMARALKPGGRLVAEFGGYGNTRRLLHAVHQALETYTGVPSDPPQPWFFPRLGEYASILERHGLETAFATLFDRSTPLDGGPRGLANWLAMFGSPLTPHFQEAGFVELVERFAAADLLRDGAWSVDYRRLRIVARKYA